MIEFEGTIKELKKYEEKDTPGMVLIRIEVPKIDEFTFEAGQAVFLGFDKIKNFTCTDRLRWSPFSIASSPLELKEGNMDFCITVKTEYPGVTNCIGTTAKVGDKIKIKGAFGHFKLQEGFEQYFFAGTGSGIAPLLSMIRTILKKNENKKLTLFYGIRRGNVYLYKEELEKYQKEGKLELIPTISRDDENWEGKRGYVQERIKEYKFDNPEKSAIFICGNPKAVEQIKELATEQGIPKEQVFAEKW